MSNALVGAPAFARRSTLVSVLLTAVVFGMTVVAIGSRPDGTDWSVWRPASGVAIGVAAWYGPRHTVQMSAAAGIGTFLGALVTGRDPLLCLGGAISAALETWIASRLLQGRGGHVPVLGNTAGLRRLFLAMLSVGAITAIGYGVTAALVLGSDQVGPTVLAIVPAHVSGALIVAPLFFGSPPRSPGISVPEAIAQWSTLVIAVIAVFRFSEGLPLAFLLIPPLIWGAIRLPYRLFAVQLVVASLAVSRLTSNSFGPFGIEELDPFAPLITASFHLTIAVMAFTIIATSAHARSLRVLLDAQALVLKESVELSVVGIGVVGDVDGTLVITDLNAAGRRILDDDQSSSISVSDVFTARGDSTLRHAISALNAEQPAVWNTTLFEQRSGRLLEVSLVGLTDALGDGLFEHRASMQFVDVTDRERARALQDAELERAAEIQRALTPKLDVNIPYYQFGARSAPSRVIGGDFYDFRADADTFVVSLGDVMGKGIGAALVASALRMSLRLENATQNPAEALARSARAIETELSSATIFATVFTAHVNVNDGHVRYVDAGHGLAVICRDDAPPTQLDSRGLPLGVVPDTEWAERTAQLDPGDTLVVFSDGLLDLFDGSLSVFSEIVRISRTCDTVEELLDQLFSGLDPEQLPDDVTAVAIRREVPEPE